MMPRRFPLPAEHLHPSCTWKPPARAAAAAWPRKAAAVVLHMTFLGLFGLLVVWPLASPIASGELAREFQPVLDALAARLRTLAPS